MGITYGTSTLFQATKGIVQDGLVLNLDAGVNKSYPRNGTTWYDLSNTGNGTLTNGPTFSRNNGGVITFDGTDDNVTLGTGGSLGLDSYHSVEFWVYPFTQQVRDRGLLRNRGSGGDTNNFIHYIFRDGNIHMGWYSNDLSAPNTVVANNWHHIVFLLDNADDKRRIYKNSSLVATDSSARTTTPNVTNTTTYLGYYSGNSTSFNGLMATCRIYNRSLTATEVLQNYNATKARFGL